MPGRLRPVGRRDGIDPDVSWQGNHFATRVTDCVKNVLGIRVFLCQEIHGDIGTLAGKGDDHRRPNLLR